jgi:DNA-binding Lrp family transcriptional regulator
MTKLDDNQTRRIIQLLSCCPEMSMTAIAARVGCSNLPVKQINRRLKIRRIVERKVTITVRRVEST